MKQFGAIFISLMLALGSVPAVQAQSTSTSTVPPGLRVAREVAVRVGNAAVQALEQYKANALSRMMQNAPRYASVVSPIANDLSAYYQTYTTNVGNAASIEDVQSLSKQAIAYFQSQVDKYYIGIVPLLREDRGRLEQRANAYAAGVQQLINTAKGMGKNTTKVEGLLSQFNALVASAKQKSDQAFAIIGVAQPRGGRKAAIEIWRDAVDDARAARALVPQINLELQTLFARSAN